MATYYVNSSAANDNGAGTVGDPWKYIPGMASANVGHTLSSADIVEIVNGSVFTEQLTTTATNVTYRGRGIGGTSITVKTQDSIPAGSTYTEHTYVRSAGTHEGSWQLDLTASPERTNGADEYCLWVQHSGCTFEDFEIIGGDADQVSGNAHNVYLEPDATNTTFNRFLIIGGTCTYTTDGGGNRTYGTGASNGGRGIYSDAGGLTLFQGAVRYSASDCFTIRGRLTGGFVPDLTCHVSYCEFHEPNRGWFDAPLVNRQGDPIQMNPSTEGTETGSCPVNLLLEHCYIWKTATIKQGLVLQGANGPVIVRYNLFEGIDGGACSILSNLIRDEVTITQNYFKNPATLLAVVRITVPDQWNTTEDPVEMCAAAGTFTFSDNIISGNSGPMFQCFTNNNSTGVPTTATLTWEGALVITGNKYLSEETGPGETTGGNATGLLMHGTTNVLKWLTTASVTISDNEFWSYELNDGGVSHIPTFILPPYTFGAGPGYTEAAIQSAAGWVITNNYFRRTAEPPSANNSTSFQIGVTSDQYGGVGVVTYADVDASTTGVEAFEAAMASATNNYESFSSSTYMGCGRVMMI